MWSLKLFARDRPRLLRCARVVRAIVMLGPARLQLLRLCQRYNKPHYLPELCPLFRHVDIDQIVSRIEETGYAYIGHLPDEYTSEILTYCKANNDHSYWNPHTACDALNHISRNSTLLSVSRKYLAAEPKLWLTQLRWTFPSKNIAPSRSSAVYNFHDFHYDTHDFKSLTIFIYLTDVDAESGPHMYIRGTHKNKSLTNLVN